MTARGRKEVVSSETKVVMVMVAEMDGGGDGRRRVISIL